MLWSIFLKVFLNEKCLEFLFSEENPALWCRSCIMCYYFIHHHEPAPVEAKYPFELLLQSWWLNNDKLALYYSFLLRISFSVTIINNNIIFIFKYMNIVKYILAIFAKHYCVWYWSDFTLLNILYVVRVHLIITIIKGLDLRHVWYEQLFLCLIQWQLAILDFWTCM